MIIICPYNIIALIAVNYRIEASFKRAISKKMVQVQPRGCGYSCYFNIGASIQSCMRTLTRQPPGLLWTSCMFGNTSYNCHPCMCSAVGKVSSRAKRYCRTITSKCGSCANLAQQAGASCAAALLESPLKFVSCFSGILGKTGGCNSCMCNAMCEFSDAACDVAQSQRLCSRSMEF